MCGQETGYQRLRARTILAQAKRLAMLKPKALVSLVLRPKTEASLVALPIRRLHSHWRTVRAAAVYKRLRRGGVAELCVQDVEPCLDYAALSARTDCKQSSQQASFPVHYLCNASAKVQQLATVDGATLLRYHVQ